MKDYPQNTIMESFYFLNGQTEAQDKKKLYLKKSRGDLRW